MGVEEVREEISSRINSLAVEPEKMYEVNDRDVGYSGGNFTVRVYRPLLDDALPAVLYVHGGGWAAGSIETHDNICRYLAKKCKCLVVSVDYRRPPEHKYPTAFKDCCAAFDWLRKHSEELGIDPDKLL